MQSSLFSLLQRLTAVLVSLDFRISSSFSTRTMLLQHSRQEFAFFYPASVSVGLNM